MSKRYRLELTVEVEEDAIEALIALGRKVSADRGSSEIDEDGDERPLSPEEDIPGVMAALMEIVYENPLLSSEAVAITEMTCSEDSEPLAKGESDDTENQDDEGDDDESFAVDGYDADLDEYEPGVWLCRWPNGDSSVVYAETKREAMEVLDQWGSADPALMKKLDSFGVDIRLTDDGEFELGSFDESFTGELYDFSYSHLGGAFSSDDDEDLRLKREAVLVEREKFSTLPPLTEAKTEGGRRNMELGMGLSPAVADLWARQESQSSADTEEDE